MQQVSCQMTVFFYVRFSGLCSLHPASPTQSLPKGKNGYLTPVVVIHFNAFPPLILFSPLPVVISTE